MGDNRVTIEAKGIREWLIDNGAKKSQINSKTVDMLEKAFADEEISGSATAQAYIESLERKAANVGAKVGALSQEIAGVEKRCSRATELLEQFETIANDKRISDRAIMDSVNAFKLMLESVRDTFGEDSMSGSVICAAINAASYGYWRSIMGPKTEGEAKRRHDGRAIL